MREEGRVRIRQRDLLALALACAAVALLASPLTRTAAASPQCPWMNTTLSPDARAHMLVKAMALDQEVAMLYDQDPVIFAHYGAAGYIPGQPSLCIPDFVTTDGASGVAQEELGTTAYPAAIDRAASFDPALANEFGRSLGWEAWRKGVDDLMDPTMNMIRNPQYGRSGEQFGEDPFLSARMAVATTEGIQSNPEIATVQQYILNDQEVNEDTVNVTADQRTLREIYMPDFEAAFTEAHAGSVLCSVNLINDQHGCENPFLLNEVLKTDWHWPGFVMSDWGATHSVKDANAGLDMEMGDSNLPQTPTTAATPDGTVGTPPYFSSMAAAVQSGAVPRSRVDDMVFRIVRAMFEFGVFDHPPAPEPQAFATDTQTPDTVALALKMSEQGTVLLKNADNVLPLPGRGEKIAVVGPAAGPQGTALAYSSGGSPHVPTFGVPVGLVSPLQGIERQAAVHGDTVTYADGTATQDAVAAAKAADVAVVFVYDAEEEAYDRPDLNLHTGACVFPLQCEDPTGENEDALISAVAQANPNTVVVIDSGGPAVMPWLSQVKGVLDAWYPGQEDGDAIASILYGETDPSAKLPITFPASINDIPTASNPRQYPGVTDAAGVPQEVYSEGLLMGYRWYDAKHIAPLFPFGFGLSYTTFKLSDLNVSSTERGADVSLTVTNTGSRYGADVAQVYVGMPSSTGEPPRQLKGFKKVWLDPGESKTVSIHLDPSAFAYWSTGQNQWAIAPGTYQIYAGDSSRNLPLQASLYRGSAGLGQTPTGQ